MTIQSPLDSIQSHLESVKNKIFNHNILSYNTQGNKDQVQEDKENSSSTRSTSIDTDYGCPTLVSSKSYDDFDRSFVFSSTTPVLNATTTSRRRSSVIHDIDDDEVDVEKNKNKRKSKCNDDDDEVKNLGYRKYLGLFLALTATFIYSLATLIVKLLKDYHPFTISVWRFQGFIVPSIPTILFHMYCQKKPVWGTILPLTKKKNLISVFLIVIRSILGCSSLILQIYAVQMMNMADASVIVFSTPVFVTLVAHVLLGEKAGIFSVLCALFTFTGVVIIARPPMLTGESLDYQTLLGSGLALGSMLLATLVYVILRYLREVHYAVTTISYGVLGSIESIILALVFDLLILPGNMWEWLSVIGLILFTYGGQTCLLLAFKFEEAGPVSLVQSTDVIFAFIWQLIFLSVYPDIYSLTGAAIVILGVTAITIRKWMVNLPENHPTRIRFSLCLK